MNGNIGKTLWIIAGAVFAAGGCGSPPPPPEPVIVLQDPLVLQEIAPLPRTIVIKPVIEYEPVYTVLRIVEVSEVNGVQKFFLVRTGADKTNIEAGAAGDIAEDAEFKKIIGAYTIIEVYGDFFRCEVRHLDYKIGNAAYIRIKTGERIKQ
jgi:hypothetical protein